MGPARAWPTHVESETSGRLNDLVSTFSRRKSPTESGNIYPDLEMLAVFFPFFLYLTFYLFHRFVSIFFWPLPRSLPLFISKPGSSLLARSPTLLNATSGKAARGYEFNILRVAKLTSCKVKPGEFALGCIPPAVRHRRKEARARDILPVNCVKPDGCVPVRSFHC